MKVAVVTVNLNLLPPHQRIVCAHRLCNYRLKRQSSGFEMYLTNLLMDPSSVWHTVMVQIYKQLITKTKNELIRYTLSVVFSSSWNNVGSACYYDNQAPILLPPTTYNYFKTSDIFFPLTCLFLVWCNWKYNGIFSGLFDCLFCMCGGT